MVSSPEAALNAQRSSYDHQYSSSRTTLRTASTPHCVPILRNCEPSGTRHGYSTMLQSEWYECMHDKRAREKSIELTICWAKPARAYRAARDLGTRRHDRSSGQSRDVRFLRPWDKISTTTQYEHPCQCCILQLQCLIIHHVESWQSKQ